MLLCQSADLRSLFRAEPRCHVRFKPRGDLPIHLAQGGLRVQLDALIAQGGQARDAFRERIDTESTSVEASFYRSIPFLRLSDSLVI